MTNMNNNDSDNYFKNNFINEDNNDSNHPTTVSNNLNNSDVQIKNQDFVKDPIQYCIETILKEVKEDEKLVRQIFYIMLSTYSNDPRNLAINAPSGDHCRKYILLYNYKW